MADFTNIDGVYAKDTELRSGINTLRTTVLSNTIKPLTVTKNGTYTAIPSSGAYGYSPITVDVQEEPWEPLEDGYSNFWFELTNDTLSPWLNFSAKTENATIDWGDGSGEVALDTLTPIHTYTKAGKYVVKVKGVTGIAGQTAFPADNKYLNVLKSVELNSDVIALAFGSFRYQTSLENVYIPSSIVTCEQYAFNLCVSLKNVVNNAAVTGSYMFQYCPQIKDISFGDGATTINTNCCYNCTSLKNVILPNTVTTIYGNSFSYCVSLISFTIPAATTRISNAAFRYSYSLSEIHCLPTEPPVIGTNVFDDIDANFIIYVPVGTAETYKSASGWSTYADHILEEGQTPNRAMLAKFNSDNTDNEEMR